MDSYYLNEHGQRVRVSDGRVDSSPTLSIAPTPVNSAATTTRSATTARSVTTSRSVETSRERATTHQDLSSLNGISILLSLLIAVIGNIGVLSMYGSHLVSEFDVKKTEESTKAIMSLGSKLASYFGVYGFFVAAMIIAVFLALKIGTLDVPACYALCWVPFVSSLIGYLLYVIFFALLGVVIYIGIIILVFAFIIFALTGAGS